MNMNIKNLNLYIFLVCIICVLILIFTNYMLYTQHTELTYFFEKKVEHILDSFKTISNDTISSFKKITQLESQQITNKLNHFTENDSEVKTKDTKKLSDNNDNSLFMSNDIDDSKTTSDMTSSESDSLSNLIENNLQQLFMIHPFISKPPQTVEIEEIVENKESEHSLLINDVNDDNKTENNDTTKISQTYEELKQIAKDKGIPISTKIGNRYKPLSKIELYTKIYSTV